MGAGRDDDEAVHAVGAGPAGDGARLVLGAARAAAEADDRVRGYTELLERGERQLVGLGEVHAAGAEHCVATRESLARDDDARGEAGAVEVGGLEDACRDRAREHDDRVGRRGQRIRDDEEAAGKCEGNHGERDREHDDRDEGAAHLSDPHRSAGVSPAGYLDCGGSTALSWRA